MDARGHMKYHLKAQNIGFFDGEVAVNAHKVPLLHSDPLVAPTTMGWGWSHAFGCLSYRN